MDGVAGCLPMVKVGNVRLIATATRERSKLLSNVSQKYHMLVHENEAVAT